MEQIILGGAISLVSAIAVIIIQHILEMRKTVTQFRDYPRTVVYNKQVQFVEAADPLLLPINEYITLTDVWLAEGSADSKKYAMQIVRKNHIIVKLDKLLEKYGPFLPSMIMRPASILINECYLLAEKPTNDQASKCIDALFELQNELRKLMGVDKLSEDLLKSLGQQKRKKSKKSMAPS